MRFGLVALVILCLLYIIAVAMGQGERVGNPFSGIAYVLGSLAALGISRPRPRPPHP
jgi:hypothetical protein